MARSRRRGLPYDVPGPGEAYYPSNRRLPRNIIRYRAAYSSDPHQDDSYGDRSYDAVYQGEVTDPQALPSPYRALRTYGTVKGFSYKGKPWDFQSYLGLVQRRPQAVAFCVRRKIRKQVLFALKRAGYSGSARKKRWQRTASSSWRC